MDDRSQSGDGKSRILRDAARIGSRSAELRGAELRPARAEDAGAASRSRRCAAQHRNRPKSGLLAAESRSDLCDSRSVNGFLGALAGRGDRAEYATSIMLWIDLRTEHTDGGSQAAGAVSARQRGVGIGDDAPRATV